MKIAFTALSRCQVEALIYREFDPSMGGNALRAKEKGSGRGEATERERPTAEKGGNPISN